jgi:hypothetical protein
MADRLARAVARFLTRCPYVQSVHDLVTKQRIVLEGGYVLDLYFQEARQSYSYSLVQADQRVIGWDNAPHHPGLPNFPHHFHAADGEVVTASLTGAPEEDIDVVVGAVNELSAERLSRE